MLLSKKIARPIRSKKVPQLKLPRSLFGLRTTYVRLSRRLSKAGAAIRSLTVYEIRKENKTDTQREMSVLRQLCRMYWRLIHTPLTMADAVPECEANNL